MPENTWENLPDWERVLSSAARLQRILPDAVTAIPSQDLIIVDTRAGYAALTRPCILAGVVMNCHHRRLSELEPALRARP